MHYDAIYQQEPVFIIDVDYHKKDSSIYIVIVACLTQIKFCSLHVVPWRKIGGPIHLNIIVIHVRIRIKIKQQF